MIFASPDIYRQIKSNNDQIELQRDLNLLESWLNGECDLTLPSVTSCECLEYDCRFSILTKLSGQVLDEVKDSKYLGVTISDNPDWSKHITTTTTKANAA